MGTELTSDGTGRSWLRQVPVRWRASDESTGPIAVGQPTPSVDLQLVAVDAKGRVPLRRAAATMGWVPGSRVVLTLHDSVLRLSQEVGWAAGIDLTFDRRLRLLLPYGVRATTAFRPGTRLMVLAVHDDGVVAAAPVAGLIGRLLGGL